MKEINFKKQFLQLKKNSRSDIKRFFLYLLSLEKFYGNYILIFVFFTFIILSLYLFLLIKVLNGVIKERVDTQNLSYYWRNVLQKHSNVPDAYYNAAIYELKLGSKDRARQLLGKALFLDPGFREAEDLRKKIK